MVTVFRNIIEFFGAIGIYDVVLPFLLVFTIIFAIMEKTRVLGTEKIGGEEMTKKNLNAMVAFVIGFFVVASSRLVAIILDVSSQMVILLLLGVFFLLLVGTFFKEDEFPVFLKGNWRTLFMLIMFVGIVAIFLQAIKTDAGEGYLEYLWNYVVYNFTSEAVGSIVLMLFIIIFIYYITKSPTPISHSSSSSSDEDKSDE